MARLSEASRETLFLALFGLFCEIWRKPRTKRSFWKLLLWKLSEASRETFVLEACSVKFGGTLPRNDHFASFFCEIYGGSLARNDHFGRFFCEIWKTPRTTRSFWKPFLWNCFFLCFLCLFCLRFFSVVSLCVFSLCFLCVCVFSVCVFCQCFLSVRTFSLCFLSVKCCGEVL